MCIRDREYIRQAEEYEQILSELPKNELHFAKSRYTVMRNEDQALSLIHI